MQTVLDMLKARKSVRAYEPIPVEAEKKRALFQAALEAPSAGNMTLFSILDITDPALKQRLSVTCDNQPFIASAPVVHVFIADYSRWFRSLSRMNRKRAVRPRAICCSPFAMRSSPAQNVAVAAEAMGLGSCYIGDILERYETHRALFALPPYAVPAAMLCIGYPTVQQRARQKPPRFCHGGYSSLKTLTSRAILQSCWQGARASMESILPLSYRLSQAQMGQRL